MLDARFVAQGIDNCRCLRHARGVTSRSATLPVLDDVVRCASLAREPLAADQAESLAHVLKALAGLLATSGWAS